jgi:hypothetical protein
MAYTFTVLDNTVHGDQRCIQGVVTADAVSGVLSLGFNRIITVTNAPKSMSSAGVKIKINCATAATASNGVINIADASSGDDMYLTVYGLR